MKNTTREFNDDKPNRGHGSPFDRGSADSYYSRPRKPHRIDHDGRGRTYELTDIERKEYFAGYEQNEYNGNKKDYR
jgi:hypothetical protein